MALCVWLSKTAVACILAKLDSTQTQTCCDILLTHAPLCCRTPPLTAAKDGGVPTSMLCGILDTMAPPAGQKPYDKLMALLTTGNGAHWVDG